MILDQGAAGSDPAERTDLLKLNPFVVWWKRRSYGRNWSKNMATLCRWEKENQYIEIEKAFSVDLGSEVLVVNTSLPEGLPPRFRGQVSLSQESELRSSVESWVGSEGLSKSQ